MARTIYGPNSHYQFTDQDPIIDDMRTVWRASGLTIYELAEKTGMASSTFYNWFVHKSVHRPFHSSVKIFYTALGIRYGRIDRIKVVVDSKRKVA
jgi:hypothetical protein